MFYGEWNDETSEYLFKCDDELQDLCRVIGVEDIKFLREHYESYTPKAMTEKMHSILSFKKVQSPLIPMDNGCYKIDFNSRYFVEDFPYGLFIIKGLADICDVVTPMIDEIIRWYLTITNQSGEYRNIPFENGIKTIEDIHSLYRMN